MCGTPIRPGTDCLQRAKTAGKLVRLAAKAASMRRHANGEASHAQIDSPAAFMHACAAIAWAACAAWAAGEDAWSSRVETETAFSQKLPHAKAAIFDARPNWHKHQAAASPAMCAGCVTQAVAQAPTVGRDIRQAQMSSANKNTRPAAAGAGAVRKGKARQGG